MTPYAHALIDYVPANAQAAYIYDYRRFAKDPNTALLLTILLGSIGGDAYYMGEIKRGILFGVAAITGIGMFITIPMWIVRCFTIQNECANYNDYLAYQLACRYAGMPSMNGAAAPNVNVPPPASAPKRAPISAVPVVVR